MGRAGQQHGRPLGRRPDHPSTALTRSATNERATDKRVSGSKRRSTNKERRKEGRTGVVGSSGREASPSESPIRSASRRLRPTIERLSTPGRKQTPPFGLLPEPVTQTRTHQTSPQLSTRGQQVRQSWPSTKSHERGTTEMLPFLRPPIRDVPPTTTPALLPPEPESQV